MMMKMMAMKAMMGMNKRMAMRRMKKRR